MCLKELIEQLKSISEIEIKLKFFYKINFLMGGDLKWLANIYGINAANSNYPCIWCHCNKLYFIIIKKKKR
jgi:hypothetical protein